LFTLPAVQFPQAVEVGDELLAFFVLVDKGDAADLVGSESRGNVGVLK
jgi:hypothetical protein